MRAIVLLGLARLPGVSWQTLKRWNVSFSTCRGAHLKSIQDQRVERVFAYLHEVK